MSNSAPCLHPVGPPAEVELLLTQRCNLKCPHCCASAGRTGAEVDTQVWVKIIQQIAKSGVLVVALTGGEPLLREDFEFLATAAVEAGMYVAVATNGWYIDKDLARRLATLGHVSVTVSLDGPREYHDRFRGVAGSFDHAVQAVELLAEAGVPVSINFMVTRESVHLFEETARVAAQRGAKSINVGQCGTLGRATPELAISWEFWEPFVVDVTERAKRGELPLRIRGLWSGAWQLYLPLLNRLDDAFSQSVWGKPPEVTPDCGTCPAGFYTCAIGPAGDLYPCDAMTSYSALRCGSVVSRPVSN